MGTALLMGRREVLKAMAITLMASVALPAMAEEAPRKGGTLNVRLNADIRATNGIQRDANTDTVMHQIFETLVGYRTDLSIGPVLAESWKVSEDGKTYTFTLREGAVYHNGDKVIAADVKWNWERRMDLANEWLFVTSFDGTQGLKVESVEAVDERNVTFKLNAPNALFLPLLAGVQANIWVASPKNVGADGKWIDGSAIGSGPFRLKEWVKAQYVALDRFDGYKPIAEKPSGFAGSREAYVDHVRFTVIPDTSAAETALFAGEIDILPNFETTRLEEAKSHGMNVVSSPGLSWTAILMQTTDPLLSNPKLRQALAHAVDISQIAAARTNGLAKADPSAVAPASAFFDDSFASLWPQYDPEKAKALAAEAGYKGEKLKIQTNTRYQGMYENSVLLQAMLTAAGFNAELEVLDWATQLDNYLAGKFQLQSFGYSARFDPSLMYSTIMGDKKTDPTAQWDSPKAWDLYLKSVATDKFDERKAVFKQLHALMAEEVPMLGLYFEPSVEAVSPKVKGYAAWPAENTRTWGVWKSE